MPTNRVATYPFIQIAREAPYQSPIIQCMICGHYDAETAFHPLKSKTEKVIRIGQGTLSLPGVRHKHIICCPRCLALKESGLGSMIHNFMAGEAYIDGDS